jgi:hypothetical protein
MTASKQIEKDEAARAMLAALKAAEACEHWENFAGEPNPAMAEARCRDQAAEMRRAALTAARAAGIKEE